MLITVDQAIQELLRGGIVGIPTETVYGLAGRIESPPALHQIFARKQRPFFDPLIVHVASIEVARPLVRSLPPVVEELAGEFWPGPLTIVCEKSDNVNDLITAGLSSVALRLPDHKIAQEILQAVGPFAAPSANLFGRTSPTMANHVLADLGDDLPVVDGGVCQVGLESTVVQVRDGQLAILRPGRVLRQDLEGIAGRHGLDVVQDQSAASPGHLKHHYQPAVPLVLLQSPMSDEEVRRKLPRNVATELSILQNLELPGDPTLAARIFYSELRRLSQNPHHIIVANPSNWQWRGNSDDLMDRLSRAASFVF